MISVIITAFNAAATIDRCIGSIDVAKKNHEIEANYPWPAWGEQQQALRGNSSQAQSSVMCATANQ